ncbi:MAG: GntR family transcriptional regulator [Bythopirellula sp.]
MKIDPRSHVPIYLQIADGIRDAVAAGVYLPGEPLPSLRVLSLQVHANPNTVQKAYDELAREGLIYSQRGKGLFVAEKGKASAKASARNALEMTFGDGIHAARAAGLSVREIRGAFAAALERSSKRTSDGSSRKAN